jgi:hypothetical protein
VVTRRIFGFVALGLWTGISSPVRGQTAPAGGEEDPRAVEAQKACIAGEVDRGVTLLADYFASTGDPIAIHNIARCYEQNGLDAKAVPKFREYLFKARDLSPAERDELEKHIGVLESRQQRPEPPRRGASDERGGATTATTESDRPPSTERKFKLAGLMAAGVGAVALGTGVVFGLQVRAKNADLAEARRKDSSQVSRYLELQRESRQAATLQWVFLGVGTAALAGGTVCYLIGVRHSSERLSISPWLGPQAAGGRFGVTF